MGEQTTINNPHYLEAVKKFKPTAVIAPRFENERYSWGSPELDAREDELIWEPALADEHSCIPLGRGLLMSKALAEEASQEIVESLKVALCS